VLLVGELDLASLERARRTIDDALVSSEREVVVDLAPLSFCDAAGVGLFLELTLRARSRGRRLLFVRPQAGVRRLFDLVDADLYLEIDDPSRSSLWARMRP
jgi:anti-anti-sigma factor